MWVLPIPTLSQRTRSMKWQDSFGERSLAPLPRSQRPGGRAVSAKNSSVFCFCFFFFFGDLEATVSQKNKKETSPNYYNQFFFKLGLRSLLQTAAEGCGILSQLCYWLAV